MGLLNVLVQFINWAEICYVLQKTSALVSMIHSTNVSCLPMQKHSLRSTATDNFCWKISTYAAGQLQKKYTKLSDNGDDVCTKSIISLKKHSISHKDSVDKEIIKKVQNFPVLLNIIRHFIGGNTTFPRQRHGICI